MKTKLYPILILGMLAVSPPLMAATESHTHTLRFNAQDLRIGEVEAEGGTYAEITLKGLDNHGEPGDPSLPWSVYSVSVPPEAVDFRVSVNGSAPQLITLDHQPMPVQHEIPTSLDYPQPGFAPLATKYTQGSTAYPENRAVVSGVSTIGGFNRVVTVSVSPFVWSGSPNMLAMQEEVQVTLTWRTDSKAADNLLYPGFPDMVEESMALARKSVVNPEAVGGYSTTLTRLNGRQRAVSSNERIPYIIVTTKALAPALERLAALRRLRGFESKIVCIEDILADVRFKDGDVVAGINDDAGKLRAFLRDTYTDLGTQYVLLAGPFPEIPARLAKYLSYNSWTKKNDTLQIYCNHYFSNLNNEWNSSENDHILRIDLTSWDAAVHLKVGRLNCQSSHQITTYIDKLIDYEYLPSGIEAGFLDNAYVMIGEDSERYGKKDTLPMRDYNACLKGPYKDHFSTVKEFYADSLRPYYGSQAMKDFNLGKYGYVDFIAHGHYGGVTTYMTPQEQKLYGITALDEDKAEFLEEEGNGLNCASGYALPSWSVSISCDLGDLGSTCKTLTFPESYLFGGKYGGVVFICNSGPGFFGSSPRLSKEIFDVVVKSYVNGLVIPYAGYVEQKGKENYYNITKSKRVIGHQYVTGDPLTMLWSKAPRSSVTENGVHRIDGLNIDDFVYVGWKNLNNGRTYIDKQPLSMPMYSAPLSNEIRTYYRADAKPFIVPVNLTDRLLENDEYVIGGEMNVKAKEGVTNSLRLSQKVMYTLESLSNINVSANIQGKTESVLRLKARDSIMFSNCTIQPGTTVECELHGEILFDSGTTIAEGATLIIN